ncbi:MAG: bacterial transcriptional activator domain-containing protein [Chloroflexi bacterium]|nr:bacterial transcriptional activator domain-containing protein [Chloroflexota bacterium]
MLTINNFDIEAQYDALDANVRLLILHPAAYSSHRMLGQLLLKRGQTAYVHVPQDADNLKLALHRVIEALNEQLNTDLSFDAKASEIAAALNAVDGAQLLIEGYDGSTAVILDEVIEEVVRQLKPGRRLVLSGRVLSNELVESLVSEEAVAVLPVDRKRLLIDYTEPEEGKTFLEVRAFGQGQVLVNGRPIDRWEGHLPRALFYFFVDRAMTTRDEIFDTFWPRLNKREATNVFHVTKRKVSEILGVHPTVYGSGFYRISPEVDLHYDVVNFQEAVQNAAIADDDVAEELYQIAIDLYHDDFLSSMDADWVVKRREDLRAIYTDALIGLARIYERRGEKEAALGLFLRASASSPKREDLTRSIMTLYAELGKPEVALETFENLEEILKKELGVSPDPQTQELANEIRELVN